MHLWLPYRVIECHYPNLLVKPCNNSNAKSKLDEQQIHKPQPLINESITEQMPINPRLRSRSTYNLQS